MYRSATAVFACIALACAATAVTVPRDDLLDTVLDRCSPGPGAVNCLKTEVLEYLRDGRSGRAVAAAADDGADVDEQLVRATGEYMERQVTEIAPAAIVGPSGRAMDEASASADAGGAAAAAAPPL